MGLSTTYRDKATLGRLNSEQVQYRKDSHQNDSPGRPESLEPQFSDTKGNTRTPSDHETLQCQNQLYDATSAASSLIENRVVQITAQQDQQVDVNDINQDSRMDTTNAIDNVNTENEIQNIMVKPLSWEERASAMERVPPVGVSAWGVNGIIAGCDARTKAFQDAIIDVQLIKEQINEYQKQIVSLQDEMSLLHMDVKLSKHHIQKLKQRLPPQDVRQRNRESEITAIKRLIEQIRSMENQLNNINYEIRYKKLQKRAMIKEFDILIKRRHWAIFHTMKHVTTDETILSDPTDEALLELEMNEGAVRRYSLKQRKGSQDQ